jgi:hypothetical protein
MATTTVDEWIAFVAVVRSRRRSSPPITRLRLEASAWHAPTDHRSPITGHRRPAAQQPPFTLSARRHVRHWVDGLVIGSELFVRDTMRRVRSESDVRRHRLARTAPLLPDALPICCWRRLRVMLN